MGWELVVLDCTSDHGALHDTIRRHSTPHTTRWVWPGWMRHRVGFTPLEHCGYLIELRIDESGELPVNLSVELGLEAGAAVLERFVRVTWAD